MSNKLSDIAAGNLAATRESLIQTLERLQNQSEMDAILADIRTYRHSPSASQIPPSRTPKTEVVPAKSNGWAPERKVEQAPHVAACDRLMDDWEAEQRKAQEKE